MKFKSLLLTGSMLVISLSSYATGDDAVKRDPNLKTFITNNKKMPDAAYQSQLRTTGAWKNFAESHRNWTAIFNEETGKPSVAYGEPISSIFSGSLQEKAYSFITNELSGFNIPVSELQYRNTTANQKYHYVHYKQFHNGMEVLWANVKVKMMLDGRIMLFGLKVYDNINISVTPSLSAAAASAAASNLVGVTPTTVTVNPDLKILPIPVNRKNDYRLVYEVTVDGRDENNFRSIYYTLVDANTGEILYRQDRVDHAANTDITVNATLYKTHPYNPTSVEPLKHLRMNVSAINYTTDTLGYVGLTNNPPVTATFYLSGPWASVNTNGMVPSFTQTISTSPTTVSFDTHANIKELSAFHSVQEIHDYYQNLAAFFPGIETTMDFAMITNIDVAGTCNAYYDGNLNLFDAGGGCNPTSEIADVVYHEYGHGINSNVYNDYGGFFGNGSLNEGYADTWANGRTEDPILGIGFFDNDPNGYVRRYDIGKKVYPQDLTGEVHANGEIIAGCWWDTGLNLGNMQDRQYLFLMTFAATWDEPDGAEGQLFQEILIEALTNDDNDGNLSNGTPHYCEITSGFAIHGITVGASTSVSHNEVLSASGQTPITVDLTASNFSNGALPYGYYKINGTGAWTQFPLNNTGGNNYQGTIPAQTNGTIVQYYIDLLDSCGLHSGMMPNYADAATDPNIPYYILVGYNLLNSNDLEGSMTGWVSGAPGDNASTGQWTATPEVPNPSDINGILVQTDADHTPAPGTKCYLTGNQVTTMGAGEWDLDGGHTTLTSSSYDLTSYTNPVFTYWRWFSNDQGATPGTAAWQVSISNDGGSTWTDVEYTYSDDHGWRRYAFKVIDYVTPSANVKLRFIGTDGPSPSLVEAAIDDVELWDEIPLSVNENQNNISFNVYPNPASGQINIRWNQAEQSVISLQITDHLGQIVFSSDPKMMTTGVHSMNVPSDQFSNGIYFIKMQDENSNSVKKITVMN